ncbi:MAG: twin-arginine translocase TatA/TatE family subunit [Planctomycetota bacterium]
MNGWIFAFWSPGPAEMLVLAVVALLLYGGNLPEVARSWGKSFAEFRRGLTGFQNELNEVIYSEPEQLAYDDKVSRDDSRLVHGYEESDDYDSEDNATGGQIVDEADIETEEFPHDRCVQDVPDSGVDDSDQTVNDFSSDTVIIEPEDNPRDDIPSS